MLHIDGDTFAKGVKSLNIDFVANDKFCLSVDLANLLSIYHDTVNRISVISLKHTAVNQEIGFFRLEKKNTNLISLYLFSNDPIFHTFNK